MSLGARRRHPQAVRPDDARRRGAQASCGPRRRRLPRCARAFSSARATMRRRSRPYRAALRPDAPLGTRRSSRSRPSPTASPARAAFSAFPADQREIGSLARAAEAMLEGTGTAADVERALDELLREIERECHDRRDALAATMSARQPPCAIAAARSHGGRLTLVAARRRRSASTASTSSPCPSHPYGSRRRRRALAAARGWARRRSRSFRSCGRRAPPTRTSAAARTCRTRNCAPRIREARALGFSVLVKPHVWVPESWAGAVAPQSEDGLADLVRRLPHRDRCSIAHDRRRGECRRARDRHRARQDHAAAGMVRADRGRARASSAARSPTSPTMPRRPRRVPFWPLLDTIGVSLYPPLGADHDRDRPARRHARRRRAARPARRAQPSRASSARSGCARPRAPPQSRGRARRSAHAAPDPLLQAQVLADWLARAAPPGVRGVLIWRWFTDPAAGGPGRHRFHRAGQAGRGRAAVRLDRRLRAALISGETRRREPPVLLQCIAAGEGGERAGLQRPLPRDFVDDAELELRIVVARKQRRPRALRHHVEELRQHQPLRTHLHAERQVGAELVGRAIAARNRCATCRSRKAGHAPIEKLYPNRPRRSISTPL